MFLAKVTNKALLRKKYTKVINKDLTTKKVYRTLGLSTIGCRMMVENEL